MLNYQRVCFLFLLRASSETLGCSWGDDSFLVFRSLFRLSRINSRCIMRHGRCLFGTDWMILNGMISILGIFYMGYIANNMIFGRKTPLDSTFNTRNNDNPWHDGVLHEGYGKKKHNKLQIQTCQLISYSYYHLVMTNSSPWKDPSIFQFGKPSTNGPWLTVTMAMHVGSPFWNPDGISHPNEFWRIAGLVNNEAVCDIEHGPVEIVTLW